MVERGGVEQVLAASTGNHGLALAGLTRSAKVYEGKTVAVVLCGRNIGLDTFLGAIGAQTRQA